jgi:hypothetical protein
VEFTVIKAQGVNNVRQVTEHKLSMHILQHPLLSPLTPSIPFLTPAGGPRRSRLHPQRHG